MGDRFYLHENKILCEYDYEERMVFANLSHNLGTLDQVRRQTKDATSELCDASSGYGSSQDSPFDH